MKTAKGSERLYDSLVIAMKDSQETDVVSHLKVSEVVLFDLSEGDDSVVTYHVVDLADVSE